MTKQFKTDRRDFLKLGLGAAAGATVAGCSAGGVRPETWPLPETLAEPVPDWRPLAASNWVERTESDPPYEAFTKVMDALGGAPWLQPGQKVLLKLALNSGNPFPATTDPWLVKCAVRYFTEAGAGQVLVGDSSGVASVHWTKEDERGSSRELCEESGLMEAINESGATPVFFEEAGYDSYFAEYPEGEHHWPRPMMLPNVIREVDHIVYLPRVSSHLMGDITAGLKLPVGFLREDSRMDFHRGGEQFYAMYEEISQAPSIKQRLRLTLYSARKVLALMGPDDGTVVEPEHGLVFGSADLLAAELLAYAYLKYIREFEAGTISASTVGQITKMRSFINKRFVGWVWSPDDDAGTPTMPFFQAGDIYAHPSIINHLRRRDGMPAAIDWRVLGEGPAAETLAYLDREVKRKA